MLSLGGSGGAGRHYFPRGRGCEAPRAGLLRPAGTPKDRVQPEPRRDFRVSRNRLDQLEREGGSFIAIDSQICTSVEDLAKVPF